MEIEHFVQNQSNDNIEKEKDIKDAQPKEALILKKIKNQEKNEEPNYSFQKSQESESQKTQSNSYSIILRTSYDKCKHNKDSQNPDANNEENNSNNLVEQNNIPQKDYLLNKNSENEANYKINDKNNNDNIANKGNVNMIVDEDLNKNIDTIDNKEVNKNKDRIENEEEISAKNNNYNPFNKKNRKRKIIKNEENKTSGSEEDKFMDKKGKIPIITLTTFQPPKVNDKEIGGKFSKFFSLLSGKKKEKEIMNNSDKKEEEESEKNKLVTLEEKLKSDNIEVNEKKEENCEDNNGNKNVKYDFVFGLISSKNKDKGQNKENDGNRKVEKKDEENVKEVNNSKNTNSYIIKAEPIVNNNKETINNILSSSEQIEDKDKLSTFSYLSTSSFVKLIRKNSKCSAILLAILLGSYGLFYLLLKKINLKTLLSKISKLGFLNNILSIFAVRFVDFMERYNDVYRLLIGIIVVICLWFVIKFHIKCFMKGRKK